MMVARPFKVGEEDVNARLPTAGNIVAAIHYYPDRETNVYAPVGLIQA
jgi:hypothetical protein